MEHNHLTIKTFMAIMAERDTAIRERNLALEERKRAFAERDMALLQRDAAFAERNSAVQERDNAIASLSYKGNPEDEKDTPKNSAGNEIGDRPKNILQDLQDQQIHHINATQESRYSPRELLRNATSRNNEVPSEAVKSNKVKQNKENKDLFEKPAKLRRVIKTEAESMSKETDEQDFGIDEKSDRRDVSWKNNLGLNQVNFDDSAMPIPVCSCTGVPQPCYKWGSGGWQSACCTTSLSMYPLPQVSNKKYSRVGGRKMSGGAFSKLLNRLHNEGYDLSTPLDLKDHWAKHGTNRYSIVK